MNIEHILTDNVVIATQSGVGQKGDPIFATQQTLKARVEYGTKSIIGQNGAQKQATHAIVTTAEIPIDARVWVPGANTSDNNAARKPIAVKKAATPSGYFIYETYL